MAERRSGRRFLALVAALSAAALVVGCASVPSSGGVHLGSVVPATGGLNQVSETVVPPVPSQGITRSGVVTQFIRAQVDTEGGFAIARTYLAPGAVWHPGTSQTTYDESTLAVSVKGTKVSLTARRTGVIDGSGYYLALPGHLHRSFTVVKVDNQWRIAALPDGVLLASSDALHTQQLATLYYPGLDEAHLVPQEILLPVGAPGLATTLANDVIGGAQGPLSTAVRTIFPAGSQVLGNVPVDNNGVAEVDLPATARTLSTADLQAVSAALVWTLRQLAEVTAVRLLAGGTLLAGDTVPSLQPISSWSSYAPNLTDPVGGVLVSHDGVRGIGVTIPAGVRRRALRDPVIGDHGQVFAALASGSGRTSLFTGSTAGTPRSRITAQRMSAPVIDQAGNVLVAVQEGRDTEIAAVSSAGKITRVAVPDSVAGVPVDELALDPTGTRIALVTGSPGHRSMQVGVLGRTTSGLSIAGLSTVLPASDDVVSVSWSDSQQIVALVQSAGGHQQLVASDPSGYHVKHLSVGPLPGPASRLAAAVGRSLLLGVGARVYRSVDRSWQLLTRGTDPSYTG